MAWINYDGIVYEENAAPIKEAMFSFQSNFGLIETLLFDSGRMPFWVIHGKRIRKSFEALSWLLPDRFLAQISDGILQLVETNNLQGKIKVRLCIFQSNAEIHFLLAVMPFIEIKLPLTVGIAQNIIKSTNEFSFMKSNNRKIFDKVAQMAADSGLQDLLLLNEAGRIVESTIANIFWEKDGRLFTPPLSEGCVAGVYRESLLNGTIVHNKMDVSEQPLTIEEAKDADALYLTNAVRGMRKLEELIFE
jgi:branched-chain amino acid aminotransferase